VMHLDTLNFSGDVGWGEFDHHSDLQNTSLNTSNRNGSVTRDLVNILQRKSQRLVIRSGRLSEIVNSFQ
jgi:hypothetical protein